MAAQEPLSSSMLQQMGLASSLTSLPGWGCLFYEADHYIYLLHKSLSDWLLDVRLSYAHAVDVAKGHLLFGLHLLKDVHKVGGVHPHDQICAQGGRSVSA